MTLLCAVLGLALGVRALWGRLVGTNTDFGLMVAQSAKTNLNIVIQIALGAVAIVDLLTRQRSSVAYYNNKLAEQQSGATGSFTRPADSATVITAD